MTAAFIAPATPDLNVAGKRFVEKKGHLLAHTANGSATNYFGSMKKLTMAILFGTEISA